MVRQQVCVCMFKYMLVADRGKGEYGELGYGPKGKKSSANPDKVPSLAGLTTQQVACGIGHTLFLVDAEQVGDMPVWENTNEEQPAAADGPAKGGKRKAAGTEGAKKRGKK